MSKKAEVKFENALLATDILVEMNNKITLIGIFANDIVVSVFPAPIRFALYLEARLPNAARYPIGFRFFLFDQEALKIEGYMEGGNNQEISAILLNNLEALIPAETEMRVEISTEKNKWKPLLKKKIVKGAVPSLVSFAPAT